MAQEGSGLGREGHTARCFHNGSRQGAVRGGLGTRDWAATVHQDASRCTGRRSNSTQLISATHAAVTGDTGALVASGGD